MTPRPALRADELCERERPAKLGGVGGAGARGARAATSPAPWALRYGADAVERMDLASLPGRRSAIGEQLGKYSIPSWRGPCASACAVRPSLPGARPMPRSMRPG